jgi:hypothetical protein
MKISELPEEVRELALNNIKKIKGSCDSDNLCGAFAWIDTKEGEDYWRILHEALNYSVISTIEKEEPKHYDNSKGSLYKFCDDHELNSYEFDIIKRVMRCRKKGNFLEDLEKTKFLIDLYIKEQQENNK